MSQLKEMVTLQSVTRAKVLRLIGITEPQYWDLLIDQGHGYLTNNHGDNVMYKALSESAMFWAWWRNHWHQQDMLFVDEVKKMSESERRQYYEIVHSLTDFTFTPPKNVLRDAFIKLNYQPKIIHHL